MMVVLGDFNTNLQTARGIAGPGTLRPSTPHKDQRELQTLPQDFSLCALNTWSLPSTQQATNIGPDHSAQIDFILVRRQHADVLARASQPVSELNFSPWRSGQRHLMVEATLPFFPGWRKPAQPGRSLDTAGLRQSVAHGDEKCMALRDRFQSFLRHQSKSSVQDVNTALLDISKDLYPAQRVKKLIPAWAQDTVKAANAALQAQQQLLRAIKGPRLGEGFLSDVFRGFRQVCGLFSKARAARQAAKQARQLRLDTIMQDAERASQRGDIHHLYKTIRLLAPKTHRSRVQIHDASGKVLGPVAEMRELTGHFTKLFAPTGRPNPVTSPGLVQPFTREEIEGKLRLVRSGISVPPGCAPSACLRHRRACA